ncbi:MAG: 50S ribosomal protein L5 [Candidatus Omnitrophota bacterium]
MVPRLQEKYHKEILPNLREKFSIKNVMAAPRLEKIVINMGVGEAIHDVKLLEAAMADLTAITGQKPTIRRSRTAISNFKLRKGLPIGCKVTLRRAKMYEFLDRLVTICLPRIRDFNGVSLKSFDRFGNYSFGITDQAVFPEIDSGRIARQQGMDITFVFNNKPKEQTMELLSLLGVPFRRA